MTDGVDVGLLCPFVYAAIATSEPEATLDESQKVYFLRRSNSVSH